MKFSSTSKLVQRNTNITVADLILAYFRLEGVTKIFGIPGAAVANLITTLKNNNKEFDYIITKQETGAGYIAEGYYRTSGNLGVVLVTAGPGATNALTASMNAQANNSAMLTITGEIDQKYFGKAYLQEGIDAKLNISAIYNNADQYSGLVTDSSNFSTIFQQALRTCWSIPRRAAHISLPNDIVAMQIDDVDLPRTVSNYRAVPDGCNYKSVLATFNEIKSAKRPLLFLGNGSRAALQDPVRLQRVQAFAKKYALPIMTTPDAKGIYPENDELSLRNFGAAQCEWPQYYLKGEHLDGDFDCLVILGSSLGKLATNSWEEDLNPSLHNVIQVDLDQSIIGRGIPISRGIIAEVGAFIDLLIDISDKDEKPQNEAVKNRLTFIQDIKEKHSPYLHPEKMHLDKNPIYPQALMQVVNEVIPKDANIFSDCANCVGWSLHYLNVSPPMQIHYSLSMGPLGFGVAGVIGGKLGAPDKTCLAIVGDGAFMMHGTEITTAIQYNIAPIWIVLNDNDLGMVSQGQAHFFPPKNPSETSWDDYYKIGNPNCKLFAESLGAEAYDVSDITEAKAALKTAIQRADESNKPQVIVAHINTEEIPPYYSELKAY
ncbi:thiamine pyrophosphate-binding protein [Flammeovirga kamogawensis]|uniref:Thiamine pyrophosphate-binding protein n=1 Tax=Flammeovirga kamogawensis TaxID=373891 RepID=A0ABX8H4I1_9BACT|nr:thiamine pyrophosphate-binding protein [Flammeovirga kamogawensis]MBB6461790.1 acetolactate synthase-1/2/3 large subunit [Flammeovirga kamogawensis]QWG10706.1 thiamine pyrophosphate-binding protein [Flammeovirga kamogawensis]TRX63808.1 thiamine pyrophosphate-binding protein [Flammeovirga kamogawensis]